MGQLVCTCTHRFQFVFRLIELLYETAVVDSLVQNNLHVEKGLDLS